MPDRRQLESRKVPFGNIAEYFRSIKEYFANSGAQAVIIRDEDESVLGILVTRDEYSLLKAVYDFVDRPDGPAQLAGKYQFDKSKALTTTQFLEKLESKEATH